MNDGRECQLGGGVDQGGVSEEHLVQKYFNVRPATWEFLLDNMVRPLPTTTNGISLFPSRTNGSQPLPYPDQWEPASLRNPPPA